MCQALFKILGEPVNRAKFLAFGAYILVSYSTAVLDHKYKNSFYPLKFIVIVFKVSKTSGHFHQNSIKIKNRLLRGKIQGLWPFLAIQTNEPLTFSRT